MFTFKGKPVTNPTGIVLCAIAAGFGLLWLGFLLFMLPVFLGLAIIADPFLRGFGRRGCVRTDGDALSIIFDKTSFERRS